MRPPDLTFPGLGGSVCKRAVLACDQGIISSSSLMSDYQIFMIAFTDFRNLLILSLDDVECGEIYSEQYS